MRTLHIVTWNILAAPWASPRWYPDGMDPSVLDRVRRATLVADALGALAPDVVCLQETTPIDLDAVVERLGRGYERHEVSNGSRLWRNWLDDDASWEPNGTAVLWRSDRLTGVPLEPAEIGPDGNRACLVHLVDGEGRAFVVVSAHLDADDPDRRRHELDDLVARIDDEPRIVVGGDFNDDIVTSELGGALWARGFVDVAADVGGRAPTHPYARPGDSWATLATIDHLVVRGMTARSCTVVDAGTWSVETPGRRIEALLARTGSDHCPVRTELAFTPD